MIVSIKQKSYKEVCHTSQTYINNECGVSYMAIYYQKEGFKCQEQKKKLKM